MTIRTTYTANDPDRPTERFVRSCHPAGYAWCERDISNKRYDLRQGTCDASDLPAEIREAADRRLGHAFSYVPWPFQQT